MNKENNIYIPEFEKVKVQIREQYLDENGKSQERIKEVLLPTKVLVEDNDKTSLENDLEEKNKSTNIK